MTQVQCPTLRLPIKMTQCLTSHEFNSAWCMESSFRFPTAVCAIFISVPSSGESRYCAQEGHKFQFTAIHFNRETIFREFLCEMAYTLFPNLLPPFFIGGRVRENFLIPGYLFVFCFFIYDSLSYYHYTVFHYWFMSVSLHLIHFKNQWKYLLD